MGIKNWEQQQNWLLKRNMNFSLKPMSDRDRKREENNRLKDQKIENREEVKEATIVAQQSITQNRWKGLWHNF